MSNILKNKKGFTLIEILVVVGLIAVLATITIVAINPAKNFRDTRNTQRRADISEILDAVTQYTSEDGQTLAGLGTIPLCSATPAAIGEAVGNVDLGASLVPEFIAAIPVDPSSGDADNTGYTICVTDATAGRVQIATTHSEASGVVNPVIR